MGRRYRARTDYVRAIGSIAFPRGPSDSSPRPRAATAAVHAKAPRAPSGNGLCARVCGALLR
jgi:hypothetical protein